VPILWPTFISYKGSTLIKLNEIKSGGIGNVLEDTWGFGELDENTLGTSISPKGKTLNLLGVCYTLYQIYI
jgi:hypothetical protein